MNVILAEDEEELRTKVDEVNRFCGESKYEGRANSIYIYAVGLIMQEDNPHYLQCGFVWTERPLSAARFVFLGVPSRPEQTRRVSLDACECKRSAAGPNGNPGNFHTKPAPWKNVTFENTTRPGYFDAERQARFPSIKTFDRKELEPWRAVKFWS